MIIMVHSKFHGSKQRYSEISSETLPSTTINESTVTEIPFSDESYLYKSYDTQVTSYLNKESSDTQMDNYRYRNHWNFIEGKRKINCTIEMGSTINKKNVNLKKHNNSKQIDAGIESR